MAASHLSGPLFVGTVKDAHITGPSNQGTVVLLQQVSLTQNSTTAVTSSFRIPQNTRLLNFLIDTTTAWNSATSATLTIGTAAAGTQYVGSIDVKTAGRATITFSAAQLAAMLNVGTNTLVYVTVTPVGATSAGATTVAASYFQV